jgi:uncharacterized membrane protein YedE/YeeE
MLSHPFVLAAIGGGLIGAASLLLLWANGRIAGISGIVSGLLRPGTEDRGWRGAFTAGLVLGGFALIALFPQHMPTQMNTSAALLVGAGLLVGFGTRLGSGCTSGHGVCGLSRFSPRSAVAVATFMGTGIITVAILRLVGGGL